MQFRRVQMWHVLTNTLFEIAYSFIFVIYTYEYVYLHQAEDTFIDFSICINSSATLGKRKSSQLEDLQFDLFLRILQLCNLLNIFQRKYFKFILL